MRVFIAAAILSSTVESHNAGDTFVHLFEWSWSDIATECTTFLGPKGFAAVQISPPMEHIIGSAWWTRYQPVSYALESRSGTAAQFAQMVKTCAAAGVAIYADAVLNHVAAGAGVGTNGTVYGTPRRTISELYSQRDFHNLGGDMSTNCVVSNYDDQHNVQYCDLDGLPDLCTGCAYVRATTAAYVEHMAALGVRGIRLDAAKHMDPGELAGLVAAINTTSALFIFQEVIGSAGEAVRPDMYYDIGSVTEFKYGSQLGSNVLADGKFQYLGNFGEGWGFMPSANAVVFTDNHDTQRADATITYKSGNLYTLANVFMLAHPYGFPKVMSSYYFDGHDQGPPSAPVHAGPGSAAAPGCADGTSWVCEHRRTAIANMVAFRRAAADAPLTNFTAAGPDTISFGRAERAWIALNRGDRAWRAVEAQTTMAPGTYCNVIAGYVGDGPNADCTESIVVDATGVVASLTVPAHSAVALHANARLR